MQNIILANKLTKEATTVALLFLAGAASAADLKQTGYPGDYCCSFWAENYFAGEEHTYCYDHEKKLPDGTPDRSQ